MLSSGTSCRPDVVSSGTSCRPDMVSSGTSCRPDVVSSGSSCRPNVVSSDSGKVKEPENPKEVESDSLSEPDDNDERITDEKLLEHIGRRGMVLCSVLMSSPRGSSKNSQSWRQVHIQDEKKNDGTYMRKVKKSIL